MKHGLLIRWFKKEIVVGKIRNERMKAYPIFNASSESSFRY